MQCGRVVAFAAQVGHDATALHSGLTGNDELAAFERLEAILVTAHLVGGQVARAGDVATGERLGGADIDDLPIIVDELHGISRGQIDPGAGLQPELRENHKKQAADQGGRQPEVIVGEFDDLFHRIRCTSKAG